MVGESQAAAKTLAEPIESEISVRADGKATTERYAEKRSLGGYESSDGDSGAGGRGGSCKVICTKRFNNSKSRGKGCRKIEKDIDCAGVGSTY